MTSVTKRSLHANRARSSMLNGWISSPASRLALALLAALTLVSCARHPLPELDLGDKGDPLKHRDAGDEDEDEDEDEPDDDSNPDDSPTPNDDPGDGDGDDSMIPDDPDMMSEPPPDGGSVVDPNDRTPSPTNSAGCPDTAPKGGPAACVLDQAVVCEYGASYRCWCAVAYWVCMNN